MNLEFREILEARKREFENFFEAQVFPEIQKTFHSDLTDACIYSLSNGGKRFRPTLVLAAFYSRSQSKEVQNALYLASAVECIHTYSLIHDDLPSMDNDDYRRGKLTCHKKFGEALAILAGDALNSFGFYLVSKVETQDPKLISDLLQILHDGAGGTGMVSGQVLDLKYEKNSVREIQALEELHNKKTGALIVSSLLLGNRLHSDYLNYQKIFFEYGKKLGLLFQVTDDIIDVESSFEELGKTPGKDQKAEKLTYISFYGLEKAKELRDVLTNELVILSDKINHNFFRELPVYIAQRKT